MVDIVSSPGRRTGVASASSASSSFPVLNGKGGLYGDSGGAVARPLMSGPGLEWVDPDGIAASPLVKFRHSQLTEVGGGTIDATGGVQQLAYGAEIDAATVYYITFHSFSAQPSATLKGGIYAAPPVSGVVQPNAALIPNTTSYNDWAGGFAVLKKDLVPPQRRKLVGLWWCPQTASPTALTFKVSVLAVPEWQKTWA